MRKVFFALALVGLTMGAFAQTTPAKKAPAKTVTKADTSKKAAKPAKKAASKK